MYIMKQILIICGVIVLAIAGLYLFFGHNTAVAPVVETNQKEVKTETTDYGFTFAYPSGADGYTLQIPSDGAHGDLVFTESIFDTTEYKQLQESTIPREAPASLTVQVYRNPMNLPAREWITQTEESNYRLSPNGTISEVSLGSTSFEGYQFDGLYRTDAYVYGKDGYIYVFANMWDNPESGMKKDMETLIAGVKWGTPRIPAQVADGDIVVSVPATGAAISSPLTVEGSARGSWYFEASFPMVLVDWDGKIIAEGIAQAQGDWMTQDFVPFKGTLTFSKPEDGNTAGALILRKDNPSGMPENDAAVEVPVTFK